MFTIFYFLFGVKSGTTIGITVYTENAQYYVETNVQTGEEASS